MDNDTKIVDTDTITSDVEETTDSTQVTENDEQTEVLDLEAGEDSADEVEKLRELNKKLFERAKKAEAKLKAGTPPVKAPITNKPSASREQVQEEILRSQGLTDDLIAELKKVATLNETDLFTAQKDDVFIAIKEKREKQRKSEDARLGAARGVAKSVPKKTFSTPGLSDEEHERMFHDAQGA